MVAQIVISAVGDAFQFFQPVRELVFQIIRCFGIVRQFGFFNFVHMQFFGVQALFNPPIDTVVFPFFQPIHVGAGFDKVFQFHLFKFADAENKVARRDFIAERLTDLRNAKWYFARCRIYHIFKLRKNGLSRFGTQISKIFPVFNRTDIRFKHQVEHARFG